MTIRIALAAVASLASWAAAGCAAAPMADDATMAEPEIEVLAQLPGGPGNITVTGDGLVITSIHPSYDSEIVAVAADGAAVRPFPDGDWATALGADAAEDGGPGLKRVLSVRADRDGKVWLLAGFPGPAPRTFYVWDTTTGAMDHVIDVVPGDIALPSSFFNDMALAPAHGVVVISDPAGGGPALVVMDMETGEGRRVLQDHVSVTAEDIDAFIDGVPLAQARDENGDLIPLRGAVNPITIDSAEEWVYYGAMSGASLYRVRLADLLDESLGADALAARVERYGDKAPSAGITIDEAGNVYVADVGARGIGVVSPDGGYRVLVQDDVLLDWPDGLAVDDDGYVYVAANGLYRTWTSHEAMGAPEPPFPLIRFKALAPTVQGR